jgi:hypothetical protein
MLITVSGQQGENGKVKASKILVIPEKEAASISDQEGRKVQTQCQSPLNRRQDGFRKEGHGMPCPYFILPYY